ncbi:MurR/RpiR family transcriptional regulator [Lacrimispora amygdalina]|uniref:MurR/RpiR family transcriptional regulator n=1 Tax=Lacrimispora amygdalina TaxID=253257 RepID=A0A3E2N995_9FIRM|nr:MurR/RpiR family transcriptional regulator [Clostridium indicum]RFZ77579.1 MurR/RpiR family transcriptional regulator [Clostridium indicum]
MFIIDRLKTQTNFSEAERIIANYILNNLKQFSEMSIRSLAENTFCSTATISRFCKKIHCENYRQLKIQFTKEMSNYFTEQRIEQNFPFDIQTSNQEIARSLMRLNIQAIQETYNTLDMEHIVRAAELINQSTQVDIYASGNSLVTGIDLYNKLIWFGKNSNLLALRGYHTLNPYTRSIPGRIAVIISYYGSSDHNIRTAKALAEAGIPYILLTGPKINPLCLNAAVSIHVAPMEEFNSKIAPFSSRTALSYVVDLIYSIMFSFDYVENKQRISLESKLHRTNKYI